MKIICWKIYQTFPETIIIANILYTVYPGFNESGFSQFPGSTNDLLYIAV